LLSLVIILARWCLRRCAAPTQAPQPAAATDQPKGEPTALPPVTLTWHLDGDAPVDEVVVEAALNNLPQMKALNTKVDLLFYDWGAFDQKMQLMFSGGEECDLVFTASWANNYINNAVNGTLIPLDELLPKYAPKIWSMVSKNAWEMSRVDGKIYAIPNQQLWYEAWGIILEKEIADKYNIDLSKIEPPGRPQPLPGSCVSGEPQLAKKLIGEVGTVGNPLYWGYDPVARRRRDQTRRPPRKVFNWMRPPSTANRLSCPRMAPGRLYPRRYF
jgi:putative aldouronate transport system substrate-binding protein